VPALEERIADPLEVVGGNTDAGVGNAKHQLRSLDIGGKPSPLPPRSVNLMAFGYKIEHDSVLNARGVAGHGRQILRRIDHEVDAAFPRPSGPTGLQQFISALRGRKRFRRKSRNCPPPIFDMSRMAVDDGQQMLAGIVDQLRVFSAARSIEDQRPPLAQSFPKKADDRVQRGCAIHGSLVARKAGLGRVGPCSAARRGQFERLLLDLTVGHVAHHRPRPRLAISAACPAAFEWPGSAFRPR